MSIELTSTNLAAAFKAADFDDVNVADVITARKDDGRAWEVILDRGGQLKATITFRGTRPKESAIEINERNASLMTEKRTVTTVFFALNDASELPSVLQAIEEALAAAK
jgi:hypothetical protein